MNRKAKPMVLVDAPKDDGTRPGDGAKQPVMAVGVLLALLLLLTAVGCKRPLSFDAQGVAHGTGQRTSNYRSGAVQLREDYVDGKLVRSRWFKPDGTLIQDTPWQDGTGDGLYLREDGSVRARMHYANGVADGRSTEYDPAGRVTAVKTYRLGQLVEGSGPPATRPVP